MTTTVEAIYQSGTLILSEPLQLPEQAHVHITIETETPIVGELLEFAEAPHPSWNGRDNGFGDLLAD